MKLRLPRLLLAALTAAMLFPVSASTVLNQLKPELQEDSTCYNYYLTDSVLTLKGNWVAGSTNKILVDEWSNYYAYAPAVLHWESRSSSNVLQGSGTIDFCKDADNDGTFYIGGYPDSSSGSRRTYTIEPGVTFKNAEIQFGRNTTTYFKNSFTQWNDIRVTETATVVLTPSVKISGYFDVDFEGGTLIAENGFTVNSKQWIYMDGFGRDSAYQGQLTLASGGYVNMNTNDTGILNINGNLNVTGSTAFYFDGTAEGFDLDVMKPGTVFAAATPEVGTVLMHTDSYSGNLGALKIVSPKYKVVVERYDGETYKTYDEIGEMTLSNLKVIAIKTEDGGFDIVVADKATPQPEYLPNNISGKVTYKLSGTCDPEGDITVNSNEAVSIISSSKTLPAITGNGAIIKDGKGTLTLAAINDYTGGTVLRGGVIKATGDLSFGYGDLNVEGGTLDLGGKAVANDIVLSGEVSLKGDAKYKGNVTVGEDAKLLTKASYKGMTTIGNFPFGRSFPGTEVTLTLADKASLAGDINVWGCGELCIEAPKGLTLAKGQTLTLDGGAVSGLVTIGAGSTLVWNEGDMGTAPVLKGGTLDFGGEATLTLSGAKAQVAFFNRIIDLPGKGTVRTNEDDYLAVNSGTVTVNALSGYDREIVMHGGTLKLATGKAVSNNEIRITGAADVNNGSTHSGNIVVETGGALTKGTAIKLIDSKQQVIIDSGKALQGTISGVGAVCMNADIDATAAKLTAAQINVNYCTFTNTKGIKLAKGQTLTLTGATVNGSLTTVAGSTLAINSDNTMSGNLTLGGGLLDFDCSCLSVDGKLTLSKAMTVQGSGTIRFKELSPVKGDLSQYFLGASDVRMEEDEIIIAAYKSAVLRTAPLTQAAADATAQEEEGPAAPLDAAPALPMMPELPATNPVADAIAQADWGILDANRAFMGAVATRHQQASLLDKGQGAAWVSAFGSSVRHGNQGAHHGSDGNIEGAALGMEHSVSETGSVGLAVGRSKNRIGATGVSRLRQETAHVALYGQKLLRNGLIADATAAWGDTETKLGGSSWQQKSAALSGRLTHAHMVNDATAVRTFGGLSYEATESGSFGAGERSGSVQNLRAEVGAGASHSAGKAHFYGEAALTGDLIRHNPSVELDGFRHHGATPGRVGVKALLGAFYEITDTWTGTASYSVEAESRSTSHTLNIGVSKSF